MSEPVAYGPYYGPTYGPAVTVSPTALRVLDALGPALVAAAGPLLLPLVEALTPGLDEVEARVGGDDGWAAEFNLATTSAPAWLGAAVGVQVTTDSPDVARAQVASRGSARGTVQALKTAAAATLTGQRRVFVTERVDGSAYRAEVITYANETPSTGATRAALAAAKPAGLVLTYDAPEGQTWRQLTASGRTWGQIADSGMTWEDLRTETVDG